MSSKISDMRAILTVSDKSGVVDLARALSGQGVELVSTGGTAKALQQAGLPVVNVSDVTGVPEMMDGRVKTLHPAVHAGILARRHRPDDLSAIAARGIRPVDIVVVNLYPFAAAAGKLETPFDELIEEIDIGGPSLLRAAAKNFRDVLVVVDPADYLRLVDELSATGGPSLEFRFNLMRKAFQHTAQYDLTIATTMMTVDPTDGAMARTAMPASHGERRALRYGENPHQTAYWIVPPEELGRTWQVHQGKELSYTNLLDLDAAVRIALELAEPAGVVIKHTNPCGVATGATAAEAYVRAREADPLSAFGGIVAINRTLDKDTATALTSTFVEAVIAPAVDDDATKVLAAKANLRVVTADYDRLRGRMPFGDEEARAFLGGMLSQERDRVIEAADPWPQEGYPKVVTKRAPTADEWTALRFAWRVCAHVKSNAVIFTTSDRTLAIGAGQMSRVDAVNVAVLKATAGTLQGSVAASDAFFPFRDGLDAVATAGATAVVQPGGSVRDAEVIAAADERGVAMVFTGKRHFRH
ncbi:MAG: bifunctional phosphoribosylaminoimidazolecarboxamide formyltransferase/IMP cyclohydrolase [Vicinamibacterales bacterium]